MKCHILILASLLLGSAGCEDVLIEKRDLSGLNEQVFEDSLLARTYVDYVYEQNLPGWPSGDFIKASDEMPGETKYFDGTVEINTVTTFGTAISSDNAYGKIRSMNQFLQEIDEGGLSQSWIDVLKGQVYFFRAWRYFELVSLYGGVPLVLTPQDPIGGGKDELFLPRDKTSACIDQIVNDLDQAIELLPGTWEHGEDWGRITSGAAAAFKARVLLYWASPQFNPGDAGDRWQRAYEASKAANEILLSNGYGLHPDFQNMWFEEVGNTEAVFITGYNNSADDQQKKNAGWDNSTRPAYLGTSGGSNQPTKQIVDAFPMKDGKKITDPTSAYIYDETFFFQNRDPRFYATIAYNGSNWPINGDADYRLWTYYKDEETSVEPEATSTGFYCRKAIDPELAAGEVQYAGTDWMEIRYAEVLLNLAESACGVNRLEEAYAALVAIRERAGIEPGADGFYGLKPNMSREEMFRAILDERQVEFAFEGKRFWDLRRHKLFESLLNGKVRTGIKEIFNEASAGISPEEFEEIRDDIDVSATYVTYFNREELVLDTKYEINWQPEYYFFALPQDAIDNNPNLEQNQGWGGAFDPLQ